MTQTHRRKDLSDKSWALLEPHLPTQAGQWDGVVHDNRRFLNVVFWILRTGAPWCDLALDYGDCENTPIGAFAAGATRASGRNCWKG